MNGEQAAFDNVVKWFPGTKVGPLEPHTSESRQHYGDLLAEQARLAARAERSVLEEADAVLAAAEYSSWRAIDLREHLLGRLADEPSVLIRDDGRALFYSGKRNALFGAYESGKTFVALLVAVEMLANGGRIVWIDFEDSPTSIVGRLLALGVDPNVIVDRFVYIQPLEPLNRSNEIDLRLELHDAVLVVIDGVNEAMAAAGLDPNKNPDVASWYAGLPRLATEGGATLITIDHVAKDPSNQRAAVGGGHKLAAVDGVAYKVEAAIPFGRGSAGIVKLRLGKDRPGWIRGSHPGRDPVVAEVTIDATDPEGAIAVSVRTPAGVGEEGAWRPTALMEKVSRFLEERDEPASQRQILEAVRGKRTYAIQAIETLVADGYLVTEDGLRGAILYSSTKPYREAVTDSHRFPTVSRNHCLDRFPVSLPLGGTVRGNAGRRIHTGDRFPSPMRSAHA